MRTSRSVLLDIAEEIVRGVNAFRGVANAREMGHSIAPSEVSRQDVSLICVIDAGELSCEMNCALDLAAKRRRD